MKLALKSYRLVGRGDGYDNHYIKCLDNHRPITSVSLRYVLDSVGKRFADIYLPTS